MRISDWSSDVCSSDLGPVEIIKIRILAETLGIDAGSVGIGFGTDDLRLFRALGTNCQGFLLAGRTHALKCTLQQRAIRPSRLIYPHINDFRAILTRTTLTADLYIIHPRSSIITKKLKTQ